MVSISLSVMGLLQVKTKMSSQVDVKIMAYLLELISTRSKFEAMPTVTVHKRITS